VIRFAFQKIAYDLFSLEYLWVHKFMNNRSLSRTFSWLMNLCFPRFKQFGDSHLNSGSQTALNINERLISIVFARI
jgi:hypothetical protein